MSNYRVVNECGNLLVIENKCYQWGVMDKNGNEIVPFGKYAWIGRFDNGYARVKSGIGKGSWHIGGENFEIVKYVPVKYGIIDKEGKEVVPMEYDDIWNFYGKGLSRTHLEKDGEVSYFNLSTGTISHATAYLPKEDSCCEDTDWDYTYGEYAGSYAQDVMGYDDDTINEAFDGDPEAYWNID
ncbi:MAG: WG repeat-containing protein [Bacteroidales bacterium]|nr:WG repeat-containing protein [Bacteroidales bacterium]